MVHPRVLAALGRPLVGHLDPVFLDLLDDVQGALRTVFGTDSPATLPISGTGSAGMETLFANLVEDGDEVVVGVNGVFGTRMCDVAERLGAKVVRAEAEWGQPVEAETVAAALALTSKPRLVAFVHAETSTGVHQPVEEIARLARDAGALAILDTVTSLAGAPVEIDRWGIDAAYSGTQKCLSCPPGLSPVTFGPRALERIDARTTKPRSWYLDLSLIGAYFGERRVYHHTAPISMVYAIAEALRLVEEEGLDARFERHVVNHRALLAGLEVLGIAPAAADGHRLPMLNSVTVPAGIDEAAVRSRLLAAHGIEIGAGLGPLAGRVWRIGLMGESSRAANVRRLLLALAAELARASGSAHDGVGAVAAADGVFGDDG